jgi:hypothetical protein
MQAARNLEKQILLDVTVVTNSELRITLPSLDFGT